MQVGNSPTLVRLLRTAVLARDLRLRSTKSLPMVFRLLRPSRLVSIGQSTNTVSSNTDVSACKTSHDTAQHGDTALMNVSATQATSLSMKGLPVQLSQQLDSGAAVACTHCVLCHCQPGPGLGRQCLAALSSRHNANEDHHAAACRIAGCDISADGSVTVPRSELSK